MATGMEHTWDRISNHNCGSFKEEAVKKVKQAEKELNRYTHYHDRWRNHVTSLESEDTQAESISAKIDSLHRRLPQYGADYTWLSDGAAQLSICRRILSHSYIFAFFALGSSGLFADEVSPSQDIINRNLFEHKQAELEHSVENLSQLIELPLQQMLEPGRLAIIKQKVLDLTVNVDLRTLHLCETIQNDILGKLSCPQGVAPYHPSTQVVRGMTSRQFSSCSMPSRPKRRHIEPVQNSEHGHLA
jgi:ariadne-1